VISQLRGRVVGMDGDALVIDVGGVGFRVSATAGAKALAGQSGNEARLFTEMVVREDSIDLFGFATCEERELFGILREVRGVGPKTALSILSALSVSRLVTAVATGDVHTLASAPGVGKRTAERLAMELRDKVGGFTVDGLPDANQAAGVVTGMAGGAPADAAAALVALGYSVGEADRAVAAAVAAGYTGNASAIIKAALSRLARAE